VVITIVSITASIFVVTAGIDAAVGVARVVTAIPIPVAITVVESSKRFIPSITLTVQFTFLPRTTLFPFCQFSFDRWNALMHKLEELTFQSPTVPIRA
jgi:hypothetical protein